MNKLTIPALLLGVVMIAGAFAFMPVQEASTVHTSTSGNTLLVATSTTASNFNITEDDTLTINSDRPYRILGITCTVSDPDNNVDLGGWVSVVDGATATGLTNIGVITGGANVDKMLGDTVDLVSDGGNASIVFTLAADNTAGTDDTNDTINCVIISEATAGTTITAVFAAL